MDKIYNCGPGPFLLEISGVFWWKTGRSLTGEPRRRPLRYCGFLRYRDHLVDHLQNHRVHHPRKYYLKYDLPYSLRQPKRFLKLASWAYNTRMSKRKSDPKHVRDYFHEYSLFVRVFTLIIDGIWWLIRRGLRYFARGAFAFWRFLFPERFKVNERQQRLHSFIVGRTGSGKSALLHNVTRWYLTRNTKPTIVLLDPHGDLADMVAKDRSLLKSKRLVYIQFGGVGERFCHLNPFELGNASEEVLNRAQLQFAGAVEQIIGETYSPRQRTLIRSCLAIMLHKPGMTLVDLIRLMQDGQNADLLQYGREHLPNEVDRLFFKGSFADPQYRTTKLALVSRLTDIVRDPVVRRFTCQPSSFSLGKLLDSGKVIVVRFDPSMQSRDAIRTIGQLFNAAILSHVLGRPPSKRYPIHMLVDECQYFVSPTIADILGEGRKFGLFMTLATQRLEALNSALQDAILGNVGNFWIGGTRHQTADKLARETGLPADRLRDLPNLHFWRAGVGQKPHKHRLQYIGTQFAMKRAQWREVLLDQLIMYYRKASPEPPTPKPSTPSTPSWKPDFL